MEQTGIFRDREAADEMLNNLQTAGYPGFLVAKNGLYYVRAGAFKRLEYAARMEQELRNRGYNTVIVRT